MINDNLERQVDSLERQVDSLERQLTLWKDRNLQSEHLKSHKQSGAVEACWAHNPKVDRSKLSSAMYLVLAQLVERGIVVVIYSIFLRSLVRIRQTRTKSSVEAIYRPRGQMDKASGFYGIIIDPTL